MTSDKQRELTPLSNKGKRVPLVPKGERINFAILIALLLLLITSLISFSGSNIGVYIRERDGIASEIFDVILCIVASLLPILTIIGIAKKSYRMLAFAGFALLIVANLCFIFGEAYINSQRIIIFVICAVPLLIPAINERICLRHLLLRFFLHFRLLCYPPLF